MRPDTADRSTTSLYAYLKNPSLVDYPDRLAAVFFTTGCNFICRYCHNALLMRRRRDGLTRDRLEEICAAFGDDWVEAAVITGGEPTLCDDLPDLVEWFKGLGWAVKLDTNGSRPEVLEALLPRLDYVAMDIKAGPARHAELTGYGDLDRIRESVALIRSSGTDHEFRTTLIEPFHDDAELLEIAALVRGSKRYVLQPFLPKEEMPDDRFRSLARTSPDRLEAARRLMEGCAEEVLVRGG